MPYSYEQVCQPMFWDNAENIIQTLTVLEKLVCATTILLSRIEIINDVLGKLFTYLLLVLCSLLIIYSKLFIR